MWGRSCMIKFFSPLEFLCFFLRYFVCLKQFKSNFYFSSCKAFKTIPSKTN